MDNKPHSSSSPVLHGPCRVQPVQCKVSSPTDLILSTWLREVYQLHLSVQKRNLMRFARYLKKKRKVLPNPASGFSALTRSRQSWLKNIYADNARLGALGSFLDFVARPADFSAGALRADYVELQNYDMIREFAMRKQVKVASCRRDSCCKLTRVTNINITHKN